MCVGGGTELQTCLIPTSLQPVMSMAKICAHYSLTGVQQPGREAHCLLGKHTASQPTAMLLQMNKYSPLLARFGEEEGLKVKRMACSVPGWEIVGKGLVMSVMVAG